MLRNTLRKRIKNLNQKKYRNQYKQFVVEGPKAIKEFLDAGFFVHKLYTTKPDLFLDFGIQSIAISEFQLKQISFQTNPQQAIALFEIPAKTTIDTSKLLLGLDRVQDPGNLGTIIRLCDWFGIRDLLCSKNTADGYGPKVVQASMGSVARVRLHYLDIETFLTDHPELTVYGAFLNSENTIYEQTKLQSNGILIMGNESQGISEKISQHIDLKLSIPRFGAYNKTESLNVATATAIMLSEFRKKARD